MAEVIELERFRARLAADQGFRSWLAHFKEQFPPTTRLRDLSDRTLLYLAAPGEEQLYVYFDLIMGVQGLGGSLKFRLDAIDNVTKLKILDAALALLDRVRFEVLRRLKWVEDGPSGAEAPLLELVRQAWRQGGAAAGGELPRLAETHPQYEAYRKLAPLDQGVFLRRLIPEAVAEFKARVEGAAGAG